MTRLEHSYKVYLLEDNTTSAERERVVGIGNSDDGSRITIRIHRMKGSGKTTLVRRTYKAGSSRKQSGARVKMAAALLANATKGSRNPLVVAGTSYGSARAFLQKMSDQALPYVVQVRPSTPITLTGQGNGKSILAAKMLDRAEWKSITARMPDGSSLKCIASKLGSVELPLGTGKLFAAQMGGIQGIHRGTIIGVSSVDAPLTELVRLVGYMRWIQRTNRGEKRATVMTCGAELSGGASLLKVRSNITLARLQDARTLSDFEGEAPSPKGILSKAGKVFNIVELFAGAGGMGLGFLLGGGTDARYRIAFSGEANPIFAESLRSNHKAYERITSNKSGSRTPQVIEPLDLRDPKALRSAASAARVLGETHIVIGGPPCQGFSMANKNSWSAENPHNKLVDVFIDYIVKLSPLVFLMENVQGMLWTPKRGSSLSLVDHAERRMKSAGYVLFPKLVDAVWYGVPQHRTRFFLLGLHKDLGYRNNSFDDWGPFPKPTHGPGLKSAVTVREAIADLPRIKNAQALERMPYERVSKDALARNEFLRYARSGAEPNVITDHVTSQHAEYVIERYRKIPPGGNWEDIRDDLTNYADVSRTHSNIYRRLLWDDPAITIGQYRKSMLVHPSQHRGLSLREASRLQSFPDWFRFSGTQDGRLGGLVHKQQQLANAVCPLVTKAFAEFILSL